MMQLPAQLLTPFVRSAVLSLHPYYEERFGWTPDQFPAAGSVWQRLVSLPLFPGMRREEQQYVVRVVRDLCDRHAIEDEPK